MRQTSKALVVFVATACLVGIANTTAASAHASAAAAAVQKPKKGGTLTIIDNAEPPGMDPLELREVPNISPAMAAVAIYDELVYQDAKTSEVKPKVAKSLTASNGGLVWTLKLHPGVKFSDGTAYDAAAVQFNWQRIANPPAGYVVPFSPVAQQVASMEIVDPATLKVTLKAADPIWDRRVARNLSSIGSPTAIQAEGRSFSTKPIGAGPFLLKDWVRGVSMTFVRNPNYWQPGKPYLDEIDSKVINDDASRYNTVISGAAQMALDTSTNNLTQYRASGKYDTVNTPAAGGGRALIFNVAKPPFNDVRVRKAIQLALDSADLVKRANIGDSTAVMKTVDETFSPYYDPSAKIPKTDVAAAQKLIDQVVSGQGGNPVEFTILTTNVDPNIATVNAMQAILATELKNVNVKLDIEGSTVAVGARVAGNFQATTDAPRWADPTQDMYLFLQSTSSGNYGRYSNPAVDAAINQLQTTADQAVRDKSYKAVVNAALTDVPFVWYSRFQVYYILAKDVKNWNMFYDLRPLIEDVWLNNKN
jgi:peptide/nickel transport system substrate-binding protein